MKLLILSDMPHYQGAGGRILGWGPTVQEIDHLAGLFETVRHAGFLHPGLPPATALPYQRSNIEFLPLPPSGGSSPAHKVGVLRRVPAYLRLILAEMDQADVVHLRCPSSVGLLAMIALAGRRQPRLRWAKYAGNWRPNRRDALSYTLQRRFLERGLHRGVVTINGRWPNQPAHVYTFFNPSLTAVEIKLGAAIAAQKKLDGPLRLLFVGRLDASKGIKRLLRIASRLERTGLTFELEVVGDGPNRSAYELETARLGLVSRVHFYGWRPRPELAEFYSRAHLLILPTASEGWPKVLSEAMAFGAVALAGAVSSIPQILGETGAGVSLAPDDLDGFAEAILKFWSEPERWEKCVRAGLSSAPLFTYTHYIRQVREMFCSEWGIELPELPAHGMGPGEG